MCETCIGGPEFTRECPNSNICKAFMCTNEQSCHNHGTCNAATGDCTCFFDWLGVDCRLEKGN